MTKTDVLFIRNIPLIDVRAEVEFNTGHFPNSVNLPILTTEERVRVGTTYRVEGSDAAIALGHHLVNGAVKFSRVRAWAEFIDAHPNAKLYCARGGLRSQISTQWLHDAGIQIDRVPGGYKALRNHLLSRLREISTTQEILVIGGKTGSGKTHFIQSLKRPFIDLEKIANHKGSSFGSMGKQPAQATFENALMIELLKTEGPTPILFEDESIMIGGLVIPELWFGKMKTAPLALLEVPLETRVQNIAEDYVMDKLKSENQTPLSALEFFLQGLSRIQRKLGGLIATEIESQMKSAFLSSEAFYPQTHFQWISSLLVHYYDPLYLRSIDRARSRILYSGDPNELTQKLSLP